MDKIQFATNVVEELSLKFTDGKECQSQFGPPQWMFTTTDDRVFFVAEKVAAKIHGMRLKPGEPFQITKAEVPYGNGRKGIEWQVARVNAPEEAAGAGVPAPAPVQAVTQPPSSSNGNGNKNGKANGNGNGNGHVKVAEPPMPWAIFLLRQTEALIDVYAMACRYAGEKHGNAVKSDDVRSLMLSAFINVSKNGGGNVA